MLGALFPIVILLPCQIFSVLKAKKPVYKLLPGSFCLLALVCAFLFLPEKSILKLLAVLYGILLLILCGIGWVIAYSVQKSRRK